MTARRMKQEDRAAMIRATAEAMAGESGTVALEDLASALGLCLGYVRDVSRGLRLAGWQIRITKQTLPRGPKKGIVTAKGLALVDPDRVAEVRSEALAPMGDGRHEIDEPPVGLPTRSGKAHRTPARTHAEACRAYLREYRRIRSGRRTPGPRPFAEHRSVQGVPRTTSLPWSQFP